MNPHREEPSAFFRAGGPFLYALPGNRRALFTLAAIDLNRADLVERRAERLEFLAALADLYARETNAALRKIVLGEILDALKPDKEYAFVGRAYAELVGFDGAAKERER